MSRAAAPFETAGPAAEADDLVLDVAGLDVAYAGGVLAACDVDLAVRRGEIVGVIGESGSGKTSLAHAVLGLSPATATVSGRRLRLAGTELLGAPPARVRALRGPAAAMIFQNPMTAFSPLHTLGRQLCDLLWREPGSEAEKRLAAAAMLARVGLPDAAARLDAYPFELSGGMLQRVAIAAALMMRPALIVADEPTTALDVTMEAQILHLMREIRDSHGVAILIISHHLGVIAEICDRVAVMYAGRIVEEGPVEAIFAAPRHPYTRALFACDPSLIPDRVRRMPVIAGEVPGPGARGCGFAARCPVVEPRCAEAVPALAPVAPDHGVRCLREAS